MRSFLLIQEAMAILTLNLSSAALLVANVQTQYRDFLLFCKLLVRVLLLFHSCNHYCLIHKLFWQYLQERFCYFYKRFKIFVIIMILVVYGRSWIFWNFMQLRVYIKWKLVRIHQERYQNSNEIQSGRKYSLYLGECFKTLLLSEVSTTVDSYDLTDSVVFSSFKRD